MISGCTIGIIGITCPSDLHTHYPFQRKLKQLLEYAILGIE